MERKVHNATESRKESVMKHKGHEGRKKEKHTQKKEKEYTVYRMKISTGIGFLRLPELSELLALAVLCALEALILFSSLASPRK